MFVHFNVWEELISVERIIKRVLHNIQKKLEKRFFFNKKKKKKKKRIETSAQTGRGKENQEIMTWQPLPPASVVAWGQAWNSAWILLGVPPIIFPPLINYIFFRHGKWVNFFNFFFSIQMANETIDCREINNPE